MYIDGRDASRFIKNMVYPKLEVFQDLFLVTAKKYTIVKCKYNKINQVIKQKVKGKLLH